jgi:aerobic carbon-monoxide dehydrogenase large subunit
VVRQRDDIAAVLGVAPSAVRVVSSDVGGNFGIRNSTCPEFALVAKAAGAGGVGTEPTPGASILA